MTPFFCKPVFLEKAFDSFSQQIYKQYYEKKVHLLFAKKNKIFTWYNIVKQ